MNLLVFLIIFLYFHTFAEEGICWQLRSTIQEILDLKKFFIQKHSPFHVFWTQLEPVFNWTISMRTNLCAVVPLHGLSTRSTGSVDGLQAVYLCTVDSKRSQMLSQATASIILSREC